MVLFIGLYAAGMVINLLLFSSIYSDLKDEGRMNPKTLALLLAMVLGSFVTWVGGLVYLLVMFFKNLRK